MSYSEDTLERLAESTAPFITDFIDSYYSEQNTIVSGFHVGVPITSENASNNPRRAILKIDQALSIVSRAGANVVALGGLTSALFKYRQQEASLLYGVAITSGSSLTSASTVRMIVTVAASRNLSIANATAVVIGASGDVGRGICLGLNQLVSNLRVVARSRPRLEALELMLKADLGRARISISTDLDAPLEGADIIVAVSTTADLSLRPELVKRDAIICDVGYPGNIADQIPGRRDLYIFRGGLFKLPRPLRLSIDLGLGTPNTIYGCFAEAMVLTQSGIEDNYSSGTTPTSRDRIDRIYSLARNCGFVEAQVPVGN